MTGRAPANILGYIWVQITAQNVKQLKQNPGKTQSISPAYACAINHLLNLQDLRRSQLGIWRRGRDSNPRYGFPYSSFQDWRLQPLGHLSSYHIFTVSSRKSANPPLGLQPSMVLTARLNLVVISLLVSLTNTPLNSVRFPRTSVVFRHSSIAWYRS